jgi:hypothetical protein
MALIYGHRDSVTVKGVVREHLLYVRVIVFHA